MPIASSFKPLKQPTLRTVSWDPVTRKFRRNRTPDDPNAQADPNATPKIPTGSFAPAVPPFLDQERRIGPPQSFEPAVPPDLDLAGQTANAAAATLQDNTYGVPKDVYDSIVNQRVKAAELTLKPRYAAAFQEANRAGVYTGQPLQSAYGTIEQDFANNVRDINTDVGNEALRTAFANRQTAINTAQGVSTAQEGAAQARRSLFGGGYISDASGKQVWRDTEENRRNKAAEDLQSRGLDINEASLRNQMREFDIQTFGYDPEEGTRNVWANTTDRTGVPGGGSGAAAGAAPGTANLEPRTGPGMYNGGFSEEAVIERMKAEGQPITPENIGNMLQKLYEASGGQPGPDVGLWKLDPATGKYVRADAPPVAGAPVPSPGAAPPAAPKNTQAMSRRMNKETGQYEYGDAFTMEVNPKYGSVEPNPDYVDSRSSSRRWNEQTKQWEYGDTFTDWDPTKYGKYGKAEFNPNYSQGNAPAPDPGTQVTTDPSTGAQTMTSGGKKYFRYPGLGGGQWELDQQYSFDV